MKILKIIHGYPNRYNAGSEVYSQTLCHGLVERGHEVVVFTRQEDAYKQEYSVMWDRDPLCQEIKLCLINMAHSRDGYRHEKVDEALGKLLDEYQPEVVHIGHLNHLSTSMIFEIKRRNLPIVFTLHDFWLMCPRGQFLQAINSKSENLYPACSGQEDRKCASTCYWRYFSSQDDQEDLQYWTDWIGKRMNHVKEISNKVDLFIAPSRYLMERFIDDFPIDLSKIIYLDYGFPLERLKGRNRKRGDTFTFGYIGTHKQAKGILHLLEAFNQVHEGAKLKIWGPPLQPFTKSLKSYVKTFPVEVEKKIEWIGGYRNEKIVEDVFNHVDAIVVPSIWGENSPLVIHEALEAGVATITANFGGMKEYVHHEVNGLLFEHRSPSSLAEQMKRLKEERGLLEKLSKGGYQQSYDGHIPSIEEHVDTIINHYERLTHESKTRPLAHHL
ncbi:glycosyltransferase [Candidatus Neptunochlamydia vexilliferae]|uniref:Glycosyltransferase n=1 Tax=Candidatus Neptunichlamydia vexilliferae TaxID=1651774 RepID=A0ABS0AZV0_9BACT|nr:glycosyltransferase [Candidatus Neptunochlamydia vexilliferae]MBF5059637.1 hypothetical protein [Candidatus Neptunochlamydia vexilliferae]